jgi:hypothetical protein
MKKLILLLLFFSLVSCNVEKRIYEHSYTNEWYYIDTMRYQVYKTKSGRKYIIVLNEKQTRFKRYYIEKRKCMIFGESFNFVNWSK